MFCWKYQKKNHGEDSPLSSDAHKRTSIGCRKAIIETWFPLRDEVTFLIDSVKRSFNYVVIRFRQNLKFICLQTTKLVKIENPVSIALMLLLLETDDLIIRYDRTESFKAKYLLQAVHCTYTYSAYE